MRPNSRSDGVPADEISRRTGLLRTERPALEADYWNRFYLDAKSNFNEAPNAFLMEMVKGRPPGVVLDYGMGEEKFHLPGEPGMAGVGLRSCGCGVALAQKRAKQLGLTLHTSAVRDSDYDFGQNRFEHDCVQLDDATYTDSENSRFTQAGRSCGDGMRSDFVRRNEMLHIFDPLEIRHYEIVRAKSDFYDRRDTDVLRLLAIKP